MPQLTARNFPSPAGSGGVNGACKEFLAGAGFADEQHVGVCHGDFCDGVLQFLKRLGGADDLIEVAGLGEFPAELLVFEVEVAVVEDALELVFEVFEDDRFDEVVERSRLECFDRVLDGRIGGDDEDEGGGVDLVEAAEECDAVAVGELDVADGDLKVVFTGEGEGFGDGAGFGDGVPVAGEELAQCAADDLFVFDDQDAAVRHFLRRR